MRVHPRGRLASRQSAITLYRGATTAALSVIYPRSQATTNSPTALADQVESVWLAFGRPGAIQQCLLKLSLHAVLWWDQETLDPDARPPNRRVADAEYSRTMFWHKPQGTEPRYRPLQEESHPIGSRNVQPRRGNLIGCCPELPPEYSDQHLSPRHPFVIHKRKLRFW